MVSGRGLGGGPRKWKIKTVWGQPKVNGERAGRSPKGENTAALDD